ncbi:hypothetical protein DPEC_G00121860 [Dallia pectoralis]|uniref:Uncharacterized protein n=1 Tax=Dallia pectoralis TaxID=75939 RepID=A0ACC2GQ73_DALPE|nr:hypothetical protein DPEC_G00121860 [Dallia pectoralis]
MPAFARDPRTDAEASFENSDGYVRQTPESTPVSGVTDEPGGICDRRIPRQKRANGEGWMTGPQMNGGFRWPVFGPSHQSVQPYNSHRACCLTHG